MKLQTRLTSITTLGVAFKMRALATVVFSAVGLIAFGCAGGGTGGTDGGGSVRILGRVVQENDAPLSGGKVTILETGDTSVITAAGAFEFPAVSVPSSAVNLEVEGDRGTSSALLDKVTPDLEEVEVTVKVSRDQRSATVPRRVNKPRPAKPTPKPQPTEQPIPGEPTPVVENPQPTVAPTPTAATPSGFPGARSETVFFVPFLLHVDSPGTAPRVLGSNGSELFPRQLLAAPSDPIWYGFSSRLARKLRGGGPTLRFTISQESASFAVAVGPLSIPSSGSIDPIPLYLFRPDGGAGSLSLFSPDPKVSVVPSSGSSPAVVPSPPVNQVSEVKFIVRVAAELNASSINVRPFPAPRTFGSISAIEPAGLWTRYLADFVSAPTSSLRVSLTSTDGTGQAVRLSGIGPVVLPGKVSGVQTVYLDVTAAVAEDGTRTGLNVQQINP